MQTFVVEDREITFSGDVLRKIPFLNGMVEFEGSKEIRGFTFDQVEAVRACLADGVIPSITHREVFSYMGIESEDSYELATVIEDDLRQNMYTTPEKYEDDTYGLVELNESIFNKFFSRDSYKHDTGVMFTHRKPRLCNWTTFQQKIKRLLYITRVPNLVVAGGCLFSALLDTQAWMPKDIDVFVYGCNEEQAKERVYELATSIPYFEQMHVKRTENALTFIYEKAPPIQVILRLYKTPSEVVHGFDVDCCGLVLYNDRVWLTERCLYALVNGYNTVSFTRLSPSYEFRLAKYGDRGIAIRIPNFNKFQVNDCHPKGKGLGRLLYYESYDAQRSIAHVIHRKEHKYSDYNAARPTINRMLRLDDCYLLPATLQDPEGECYSFALALNDAKSNMRLDKAALSDISYITRRALSRQLLISNPFVRVFNEVACPAYMLPLLFELDEEFYSYITTFTEILLEGGGPTGFNAKHNILPRVLTWKTINPGEQTTGTFHKLVLEDVNEWYKTPAYIM